MTDCPSPTPRRAATCPWNDRVPGMTVAAPAAPPASPPEKPSVTTPVDVPVPTIISENVLIEPDAVRILDRRVFPFERTWVTCRDHEDVAKAIEDMVTQSSGPMFAAAAGMTLAARDADRLSSANQRREVMTAEGGPRAGRRAEHQ